MDQNKNQQGKNKPVRPIVAVGSAVGILLAVCVLNGCAITKTETDMIKTKRKEIIHRDYRDKYMEPAYIPKPAPPAPPTPVRRDTV